MSQDPETTRQPSPGAPTYSNVVESDQAADAGTTDAAAAEAPTPEGPEHREGTPGDQGEYVEEAVKAVEDDEAPAEATADAPAGGATNTTPPEETA